MKKVTSLQAVFACLTLLVAGLLLALGTDLLLTAITITAMVILTLCAQEIDRHIFFVIFLFSLYIFLVSGDLAEEFSDRQYWQRFSEEANVHAHICILISVAALGIGYAVGRPLSGKVSAMRLLPGEKTEMAEKIRAEKQQHLKEKLKSVSLWVYYVFYLILMFDTLNKVYYVQVNGYVSYYTGYRSMLGPLAQLGDFAPIALCAFLATFPSKKECRIPLWLFFIYAACGFLIGQRGALIYNMAFLAGYILFRNGTDKNGERWIRRWWIIAAFVAAPFAMVALQLYMYIRNGQAVEFNSLGETFVEFFLSTGSSSKVIKAGYDYRDKLTEFKFYSLGDTLNYFKYSRLFNWTGVIPAGHTEEYATQGHSFGDMISFVYAKKKYLAGEGEGSSFIACLFTDFGYVGVGIGSFLYGLLFKAVSDMDKGSWLPATCGLYALMFLMKAPRGSYDCFVGGIVNVTFICVLIMIYVLATCVTLRRPLPPKKEKQADTAKELYESVQE